MIIMNGGWVRPRTFQWVFVLYDVNQEIQSRTGNIPSIRIWVLYQHLQSSWMSNVRLLALQNWSLLPSPRQNAGMKESASAADKAPRSHWTGFPATSWAQESYHLIERRPAEWKNKISFWDIHRKSVNPFHHRLCKKIYNILGWTLNIDYSLLGHF